MEQNSTKKIVIIAGPNGAGKTTFAREYLPHDEELFEFINADLIAEGLSPFKPESVAIKAGRIMSEQIKSHVDSGKSFAFETTLAGRRYMKLIPEWKSHGYIIKLFFLKLSSVEQAIRRVSIRVAQGGHSIPEQTIRRRYTAGFNNFNQHYKSLVDEWILFDNSKDKSIIVDQSK